MEALNPYMLERTAATIENLLGVDPHPGMAPPMGEVVRRFGSMDRVVLYNPDAVAQWVFEKYRGLFAPILRLNPLVVPMRSPLPPVTPVCFASMYSGVGPSVHGIRKYEKPVLKVRTLFDDLPSKGRKVALVSTAKDSMARIFLNRNIDYFVYPDKEKCNRKALELITRDKYDLIVLYNGDYDHFMHRVSPTGKRALRALREDVDTFLSLHEAMGKRSLLVFAPDHGCHEVCRFFGSHGIDEAMDRNVLHFYLGC